MALASAAIIALVALILAPGVLFYYDVTPKLITLLTGAGICAVLWRGRKAARSLTFVLECGVASLALSAAVSSSASLSVFGSTWRRFGVVAQLALLALTWLIAATGHVERRAILRSVALSSGATAFYGIAQYFGWDPILHPAGYHIGEGLWTIVRPPGTFGYVSYFATWLLTAGFLSLELAAREESAAWRRIAWACAAACFTAMLLTGTRAAILGFAVGLLAAAVRRGVRISPRVATAGCAVAIALTVFYFTPAGWQLRSRTRWFREDPWGGARLLLWRDSLSMAASRPLTGFGGEVFTAAFPRFESVELARAYPDFAHESPHNMVLDAWISQGIPGVTALVALCGLGICWSWRERRMWLLAALTAGIAAQQFTAFTIPTALLFYAAVALSSPVSDARASRTYLVPRMAFAAAMFYCAFRFAAADRHLELARQRLTAHDFVGSAAQFAQYDRLRFPGASAGLWYSRALLAQGAVIPAGQAALAATRDPEDPFDAWYNLAEIYAVGGDAANTEASLRRSIAAKPKWFKPHWTLARLLRIEGRTNEAAREAAIAAQLDGGKHDEVTAELKH